MEQYQFERWQQPQQKLINQFYKRHKQNVSCHKTDKIYLIRDNKTPSSKNSIIAVTFIRHISTTSEDLHLLRSLFVAPEYRNKGLAKKLLQFLMRDPHPALTVICESKLTNLYLNLGFTFYNSTLLADSNYLSKFNQKKYDLLINNND